jgi:hypothetical protein
VNVAAALHAGGVEVPAGAGRLTGAQAAAYATWLGRDELAEARLSRFQAVLAGLVDALPTTGDRLTEALGGLAGESAASVPDSRVADLLLAVRDGAAGGPIAGAVVPLRPVTGAGAVSRAVDVAGAHELAARLLPSAVLPTVVAAKVTPAG